MKNLTGYSLCQTMTAMATLMAMTIALPAVAADLTATMHRTTPDGTGEALGTITIASSGASSGAGATLKLNLHGLPPGPHGFHVHENGNCGPTLVNGVAVPGGAAGGHLDPEHTGKHEGPTGAGHFGDLPALNAAADGTATQTLTAPRIKTIEALKGRALIIHAGGDNYGDLPSPLGGGGARFACGLIE